MWSYRERTKRLIDVVVAGGLLLLFLPLIAIVSLAIWLNMGRPILFRQLRPGKDEVLFSIYKFRTMTSERDHRGRLLPNVQRITPLGRLLRSTSLDELPQLWNVLRGEMSLIGPRPLLPEYVPLYSEHQRRRHEVAPGITGWAQVNGRNVISWEERFDLDVWYVDNQSFHLDLKIIWLTALKILRREGVNESESVTMTPFRGSSNSS